MRAPTVHGRRANLGKPLDDGFAKQAALMGPYLLLALHVLLSVAGFALLWRRLDRQRMEIMRLKELLAARSAAPARKLRAGESSVVSISELAPQRHVAPAPPPSEPPERQRRAPTLAPETARALTLALMAAAPAIGFFFDGATSAVICSGLAIAAAMMVIALRPIWRVAAWAGALAAAGWSGAAFAMDAARADPISFSFCVALAGVAGIVHAYQRNVAPGATLALLMAAAALALGSQIGLFDAPGAAFAIIVATAAIAGASSLRLEAMHLAAFGAAVLGLFVLSGQESAAIWFTPAAAWSGALFFAIAAVRVPQLGARGVALAGTGAFAPLGAIAALYAARHGLAEAGAAALAFLALAFLLSAVLAMTALRRERGLAGMRVTLWVQALGVFTAISASVTLALPAHFAAAAFAAVGLACAAIDARWPDKVWRAFSVIALLAAGVFAISAARTLLSEAAELNAWLAIGAAFVATALLSGAGAYLFERSGARATAAAFEAGALLLALAGAHLLTRLLFADGATMLRPITFVEASAHASLWLAASLAVAARMNNGASALRDGAARTLAVGALAGLLVAGIVWLFSLWPQARDGAWFGRASLGFLIPALLLWGHWAYWRTRRTEKRARVAFAAAAAASACALSLEVSAIAGAPDWARTLGVALLLAAALGANFLPGLTHSGERLRLREKSPSQSATQAAR